MHLQRRLLLSAAMVLAIGLAAGGTARADAFQDGVTALQAGQYAVALDAWQKPAEAGDPRCQYGLGYLYQFGLGTDVDNAQATAWYQKAAAQNNPDAIYALAAMYESGRAGTRDRAKALILYRQAAATGKSPSAEYALGRIYLRGDGVTRDEREGLIWLGKAAQDGQPAAQYMLGAAYEVGTVVKQDRVEAYYWYSGALDGDQAVLHGTDPEFDPKTALEALAQRMSYWEIEQAKAKLKKTPPPQAPLAHDQAAKPSLAHDQAKPRAAPSAAKPAATGTKG